MAKLKLKSSQWIVDEHDNPIIGKGRMEILDNIEKTGSINQTAKMMQMSYKAVWSKIKATEKNLNTCMVHRDRKEGSRLSRAGKDLASSPRQGFAPHSARERHGRRGGRTAGRRGHHWRGRLVG